ncbi:MAG TPA: YkgJ family cysteine cluster protein [Gemmataceae bacterium]|nr:YkgJ family cysteine cluster protein [Gemmataceae bacterium]
MAHDPPNSERVTLGIELVSTNWKLKTRIAVPAGPTRLIELLPLANSLADAVAGMAEQSVEKQGEKISCKKGCAACCRWMAPVSEVEARRIRKLVDGLPEPRRSQVLARFTEALRRLDQAGLLDRLRARDQWADPDYRKISDQYYAQGITCPFLEDESCSIYADRPATCRELLVTSPAEKCALPTNDEVRAVKLPFSIVSALARFDPVPSTAERIRWVPLVLALEWAAEHADESPARPGPELVRELFQHVADREGARLGLRK